MSNNLTDFFPAAGGGGSGLYFASPREMPCTWRLLGNVNLKTGSATLSSSIASGDFQNGMTRLGCANHVYQSSEDNTYVELTNVTNANGGVFHGAISPSSQPASTSYSSVIDFRITIDGTEYIVSGDTNLNPIGNGVRALIGNFPIGMPSNTTTTNQQFSTSNPYYAYVEDTSSSAGFQNGSFTFLNDTDRCFVPAWLYQMGGVRFNETLKVEIKTKNVYVVNNYYQAGYSLQTLY
tara:strand:- start:51 stop:758 length:708 start_codon:yes stop_codon:yes gene_type:complete